MKLLQRNLSQLQTQPTTEHATAATTSDRTPKPGHNGMHEALVPTLASLITKPELNDEAQISRPATIDLRSGPCQNQTLGKCQRAPQGFKPQTKASAAQPHRMTGSSFPHRVLMPKASDSASKGYPEDLIIIINQAQSHVVINMGPCMVQFINFAKRQSVQSSSFARGDFSLCVVCP